MWRSPPFGIWEGNAVSWSGLTCAAFKARMASCSGAVATGCRTEAALFARGWGDAAIGRQRRSTEERLGRGRSIGRLYDFDMRKDSASRAGWRRGASLLYLVCVCFTGSPPVTCSPDEAGATCVDRCRSMRTVVLGDPRHIVFMPMPDSSLVERGPK